MLFNTVQHHTFQIRVSGPKFACAASLAAQNQASGDRSYGSAMVMTCSVDVPAAIFSHFLVQQRHFLPKKEKLGFQRPSGGVFSAQKGNLGVPEAIRWLTNLFTNSNVVQVLLSVATVVTVNNNATVLRSQR